MRAVMDLGGLLRVRRAVRRSPSSARTPSSPRRRCRSSAASCRVGLMLWGGAALGGAWVGLVFLAWPALFLSLGWNFLEYGFFPPEGGWVWSWIFCGVLFVADGRRSRSSVGLGASCDESGWQPGLRLGPGRRPAAAGHVDTAGAPAPTAGRARAEPACRASRSSIGSNGSRPCAGAATSHRPSTRPPRPRRSPKRRVADERIVPAGVAPRRGRHRGDRRDRRGVWLFGILASPVA